MYNLKYFIIFLLVLLILITFYKIRLNSKKIDNFTQFNFEYDNDNKLKLYEQCNFSGIGFKEDYEKGECSVAIQIIPKVKNVLEIGGGAGKVSHMINKLLEERGLEEKHVVVEPGKDGIGNHNYDIQQNKEKFKDSYTIVNKYAEDLTMEDLKLLDNSPDCLFVDCEGCLHKFFDTEIGKHCLKSARFVVNEQDSFIIKKDIKDLHQTLENSGFTLIANGYGCGTSCLTDVWYKEN